MRLLVGGRGAGPIILKLESGLQLKIRSLMDAWIVKESCLDEQYKLASTPIADGWTVIDIGAGLGDFAVSIARKHPLSIVYAFEPFPESYALLEENIALNAVRNVRPFTFAVGSTDGTLALRFPSGEAVQHSTTAITLTDESLEVRSITLEQIFSQHQLERCDYLKMDCEGAEYDILLNAGAEVLRKIRHICLEYHDGITEYSHGDLVMLFEDHGFRVRLTPNPVHGDLGYLYAAKSTSEVGE